MNLKEEFNRIGGHRLNEENYVFIDADGKKQNMNSSEYRKYMDDLAAEGGYALDDDQHEAVQLLQGLIDKKGGSQKAKLNKHFSEFMNALFGNTPLK